MGQIVQAAEKHRDKILEMDKVLKTKTLLIRELREEMSEHSTEAF